MNYSHSRLVSSPGNQGLRVSRIFLLSASFHSWDAKLQAIVTDRAERNQYILPSICRVFGSGRNINIKLELEVQCCAKVLTPTHFLYIFESLYLCKKYYFLHVKWSYLWHTEEIHS